MQGLSVLIPVYNFDVKPLAASLSAQLSRLQHPFEIRLIDDASTHEYKKINEEVENIHGVKYTVLENNIGRSKIRNILAKEALYENLLFLDCDNEILSENYIENYSLQIAKGYEVIVGGTAYQKSKPKDKAFLLHWKAGKYKEEKTATIRNEHAYDSFTLNNMLIKKSIYLSIQLDESITTYGHEDSKFGYELQQKQVALLHVDNFVCHIGLNSTENYLHKSLQAVDNLCRMIKNERTGTHTKLYKAFNFLKIYRLRAVFGLFYKIFKPIIYKNLYSQNPSLILLDVVKLHRMNSNF